MSDIDLAGMLVDIVGPGGDVIVVAADPGPVAEAAVRAAGPNGSVRVAAWTAEQERSLAAGLGARATVFRAAPGDLGMDVLAVEERLAGSPARSVADVQAVLSEARSQAASSPVAAPQSVDAVLAIDILGMVAPDQRPSAIAECYRVLRRAGKCLFIDTVSDEPLPARLAADPDMPAVMQESDLMAGLEDAKFHGLQLVHFPRDPLSTVEGIDCRRVAIVAHKGKEGVCRDGLHAVVYKGPFKVVEDDDGHVIRRGVRFAVCWKTFGVYQRAPYAGVFEYIEPLAERPEEQSPLWDPSHPGVRSLGETKGLAAPASASEAPRGGAGKAYVARAVWLAADGAVKRRARATHRYRGYFESHDEAMDMARKLFEDASRYEVVEISMEEALERMARTGRQVACPVR